MNYLDLMVNVKYLIANNGPATGGLCITGGLWHFCQQSAALRRLEERRTTPELKHVHMRVGALFSNLQQNFKSLKALHKYRNFTQKLLKLKTSLVIKLEQLKICKQIYKSIRRVKDSLEKNGSWVSYIINQTHISLKWSRSLKKKFRNPPVFHFDPSSLVMLHHLSCPIHEQKPELLSKTL